jgi:hypothetical protein
MKLEGENKLKPLDKNVIFSQTDLAERWGVTRQVVKNWEFRHNDFPQPIATVNGGKTKIYALDDVLRYESSRRMYTNEKEVSNNSI